jgi:hypothetical protein
MDMGVGGKVLAGLIVYALIILISIPFIIVCRRYLPSLSGYGNYFYHEKINDNSL